MSLEEKLAKVRAQMREVIPDEFLVVIDRVEEDLRNSSILDSACIFAWKQVTHGLVDGDVKRRVKYRLPPSRVLPTLSTTICSVLARHGLFCNCGYQERELGQFGIVRPIVDSVFNVPVPSSRIYFDCDVLRVTRCHGYRMLVRRLVATSGRLLHQD
jgi:hypothetical protein